MKVAHEPKTFKENEHNCKIKKGRKNTLEDDPAVSALQQYSASAPRSSIHRAFDQCLVLAVQLEKKRLEPAFEDG